MPTRLNMALFGLGRMGRIYARTIAGMDTARLHTVVSLDADSQHAFLAELGVRHAYARVDTASVLLDVDAVVIATPTSLHRDLVLEAAAAGKAIFCEKPLALTLDDTHRILEAVDRASVPLQVGFMRRYDSAYLDAKALIDAGEIGLPVTFKAVGRDPFCPRPEFADPSHSGGLILDMGIHDMDVARWFMGTEVERVTAEGSLMVCGDLKAVGDIDNAVINLRFENGAIGNVEVSRNAFYGYDIRTEVLGSKAAVRVGGDEFASCRLLSTNGASDRDESYLIQRFGAAYQAQIRDFVGCVRDGRAPSSTGVDALAAFEICLAATYAAQTGRPVTLDAVRSGWTPSVKHPTSFT